MSSQKSRQSEGTFNNSSQHFFFLCCFKARAIKICKNRIRDRKTSPPNTSIVLCQIKKQTKDIRFLFVSEIACTIRLKKPHSDLVDANRFVNATGRQRYHWARWARLRILQLTTSSVHEPWDFHFIVQKWLFFGSFMKFICVLATTCVPFLDN